MPFTEPFAVPTSNAAAGVATAEVEKTSEPSDRHATDVDLYLSSSTEKAVDGGDDLADKASTAAGGEDSGVDLAKIVGGEPLPNEGVDQTSSHQSGKPEHKLSQPSKIPSRSGAPLKHIAIHNGRHYIFYSINLLGERQPLLIRPKVPP